MCSGAGWTALRCSEEVWLTRYRQQEAEFKRNTDKPSEFWMHVRAQFVTKPSVELLDLGSEIENPSMTFDL